MAYTALYRKYRPMVFDDVIGQESIVGTLKNQIRQDSVAHAYLFAGTRGTGKTSTAKILARAINCLEPDDSEPCNECEICRGILGESIMDVVEIDAASNNSVDDVRELRENARYAPAKAKNKVYIIDEVHMLSKGAFNALLKILEEPPSHTVFILATTEPEKIPETIRSRCQRFDFRRIGQEDLLGRIGFILDDLDIEADEEAKEMIVRNSDGAARDALSLLDQCLAFSQGAITVDTVEKVLGVSAEGFLFEFIESVVDRDADAAFKKLDEIFSAGKETNQFLRDLTDYLRALMLAGLDESAQKILGMSESKIEKLRIQRKRAGLAFVLRGIDLLSDYEYRMKYAPQPRVLLEMLVLRLLRPEYENSMDAMLQRLEKTEKELDKLKKMRFSERPNYAAAPAEAGGERHPACKDEPNREESFVEEPNETERQPTFVEEPDKQPAAAKELSEETAGFSELMDRWQEVLGQVRGRNISTHAFLREAVPKDIKNGKLILLFKDGYDVHMKKLSGDENKNMIESILLDETGRDLSIECVMEGNWNGGGSADSEESMIKEVFKGFEGPIEIQD